MNAKRFWAGALSLGLMGAVFGCAQGMPTSTDQVAPQSDRQVLSTQSDMASLFAQLPERIPVAEADKLLVELDPDKVVDPEKDKGYKVQQWGRYGLYSRFWPRWGAYRYYGLGNYYFPYSRIGAYYYPYRYSYLGGLYNPYFSYYGGLYRPYLWW